MSMGGDPLERRLAARRLPEPLAELRQRVLAGVHEALRESPRPTLRFSRFALATAAVVLVGMNLSMSLSLDTDYRLSAILPSNSRVVDELRTLWPDASNEELERQAMLIRASQHWVPAPAPTTFLSRTHGF